MRHVLALATVLAAGCTPGGVGTVYVFQFAFDPTAISATTVEHNFKDADERGTGGGDDTGFGGTTIETTTTIDGSPRVILGQIVPGTGTTSWLTFDGAIIPGTNVGGIWTFEWDRFGETTTTDEGRRGYVGTRRMETRTTTKLVLEPDPATGGLKGSAEEMSESVAAYTESDRWDGQAVGRFSSIIPSTTYLEGDGDVNTADEAECSGEDCELKITTTLTATQDVTAEATALSPEDVLGATQGAEQPSGPPAE